MNTNEGNARCSTQILHRQMANMLQNAFEMLCIKKNIVYKISSGRSKTLSSSCPMLLEYAICTKCHTRLLIYTVQKITLYRDL